MITRGGLPAPSVHQAGGLEKSFRDFSDYVSELRVFVDSTDPGMAILSDLSPPATLHSSS
jgi:hypothetical protein